MLPDTLVGTEVPNLIFKRTENHALKSQVLKSQILTGKI